MLNPCKSGRISCRMVFDVILCYHILIHVHIQMNAFYLLEGSENVGKIYKKHD